MSNEPAVVAPTLADSVKLFTEAKEPTLVIEGTFAIHADGKGGAVIVMTTEQHGTVRHPIGRKYMKLMSFTPFGGMFKGGE